MAGMSLEKVGAHALDDGLRRRILPIRGGILRRGGDEWTPDEERKLTRHNALRAELAALYNDIGACSLDKALALYFTDDVVRRYAGGDLRERTRVEGWLHYCAARRA